MKITVKRDFYDREADLILRKKGETLDVSDERGKELTGGGFAEKYEKAEKTKKKTGET